MPSVPSQQFESIKFTVQYGTVLIQLHGTVVTYFVMHRTALFTTCALKNGEGLSESVPDLR